ncbi:MAG TPA: hypothetical protein VJ860_05175 [Polyangia bacterium]|jgi:hypothetical protein|nr:hypothetical protein [Polyangia bacterium]
MFVSWLRLVGLMVVSACLAAGCSGAKKIDVGGTCILNSDCNGSLVCTMGKCHDACHTSADCLAGQSCVKTDDTTFCQLPAEAFCSQTSPCGGTFVCASDEKCRTPCQSRTACTSEQVCVSGVCAAPVELGPNNQLPQSGSGLGTDAGADGGSSTCGDLGPGQYYWQITQQTGQSTAKWVDAVTPSNAHVTASNSPYSSAGVIASLTCPSSVVDLSAYDQIVFTGTIPIGQRISVSVSRGQVGCGWYVLGRGSDSYVLPLANPNLCWPLASYFELQADSIWFGTLWSDPSNVDIQVTNLEFRTTGSGAGPVIAPGGLQLGVNGYRCGIDVFGYDRTASWVGAPFANTMHFVTVPPTEAPEAIACAITGEPVDLTGYHDVQFQAKVTTIGTSVFAFALRDATSAEVMYFPTATGISTTYTLPLASPDRCYDGAGRVVLCGGFDYSQVAEVTFGDCWFASSTLKIDLEVTSLAFLQ